MSFKFFVLPIAALSLTFGVSRAHADTYTNFSLNGVTLMTGSATGGITIDTTTGIVTAANVSVFNGTPPFLFNITDGTNNTAIDTFINFLDQGGDIFQLSVAATTLVGYQGSAVCTYSVRCSNFVGGFFPGGVINGPS